MNRHLIAAATLAAAPALAQTPLPPPQAALKAHVAFLASDAMRGREAGTPEYEIAAEYVATQLMAAGVKPAGSGDSYFQTVPLVSFKAAQKGQFTLMRNGAPVDMVWGTDYISGAGRKAATDITGEVVFVGYGVVAPELNRDDFAGVDVRGKIVAFLAGAPSSIPGEIRAHYSGVNKAVEAQKRGAIASISIYTPTREKTYAFSRAAESWADRNMTWAAADGTPFFAAPNLPGLGTISLAGAQKLFAGSKFNARAIMRADETGRTMPRGALLPVTLNVVQKTEVEARTSRNVVGVLSGSDPTLAAEHVVLSAHLDHEGVGPAVKGDTIYNGAMDNAVGIASMIEVARAFATSGTRPKRSIMFLAVTAEEKGLVGSDYYARNPTVPIRNIVANVNLDMPIITYRFTDLIAFGADRSQLGPLVGGAVGKLGFTLSPDPSPEEGIFTRSDHYRFVQQGVPSVFLVTGQSGVGKAGTADFLANHYHRPSDQVDLPIDWTAGASFVRVNYEVARAIADAPERPRWNKGDFFGTLYNGFGAK